MKDHYFVDEDGSRTPVSQLPKAHILDMLARRDIEIVDDGSGEIVEDIIERLKIELLIRELGL